MQDLLPHYERELGLLRAQADEFAKQFPRIAGRLSVSGDVLQDPHVERLIQAFALLTSRIHKRLDDDFPLFTESFLDVLYPHYLRPFPSCTIAHFDIGPALGGATRSVVIERGTAFETHQLCRSGSFTFRTSQALTLAPVRLTHARFQGVFAAPTGTAAVRQATAMLSVSLELASSQATWSGIFAGQAAPHLRVYLDANPSQVTALREVLTRRTVATMAQTSTHGPWVVDQAALPRLVGLDDDEALIEFDARSSSAYRLLTEYFAFPEKFNFVDLPIPAAALRQAAGSLTLHFALQDIRSDSDEARLLELTSEQHLKLHCVPMVNLTTKIAKPIDVDDTEDTFHVVAAPAHPHDFEIYAIDRVFRLVESATGPRTETVAPFYSLQHRDLLKDTDGRDAYWYVCRDSADSANGPGYRMRLGVVDAAFDPTVDQAKTLSIEVRATNGDLPSRMSIGAPGGDLKGEGSWAGIRLLRTPTPTYRFERERGALWRLISHLSLNHLTLSDGGLDALKEMLGLYNLPRSAENARMLDGLVAIEFKAVNACMPGNPFPTFVRGTEVRLSVNEQHFVGSGLHLFSQVLDRFLGLYVHLNSFTQLKVISASTQATLVECERRMGDIALI